MAHYLTEDDVKRLLTMPDALVQVERAFVARAEGRAFDIPRKRTRLPRDGTQGGNDGEAGGVA